MIRAKEWTAKDIIAIVKYRKQYNRQTRCHAYELVYSKEGSNSLSKQCNECPNYQCCSSFLKSVMLGGKNGVFV